MAVENLSVLNLMHRSSLILPFIRFPAIVWQRPELGVAVMSVICYAICI